MHIQHSQFESCSLHAHPPDVVPHSFSEFELRLATPKDLPSRRHSLTVSPKLLAPKTTRTMQTNARTSQYLMPCWWHSARRLVPLLRAWVDLGPASASNAATASARVAWLGLVSCCASCHASQNAMLAPLPAGTHGAHGVEHVSKAETYTVTEGHCRQGNCTAHM